MKKHFIITLAALSLAVPALADTVTVIVKEKGSDKYQSLQVEHSEIEKLKNSGRYSSVEKDSWFTIPDTFHQTKTQPTRKKSETQSAKSLSVATSGENEPNDPEYSFMYYWQSQSQYIGSSEINDAVNKSVKNKKLRIAVIDGGFADTEDFVWTDGYNFFEDWGQVPGPEFRTLEDTDNCETGHGTGIAGIIGAIRNNNIGIAGVVDAELVPVRAFSCNMAKYSTVAKAIRYASGDKVDDAPVIEKVDIINISMGGEADLCPDFLQEAINYAREQNIQIYVAAGNQGIDVNGIAPALCEGVTVVGATNRSRVKTVISNYGSLVDFMIAGYDVKSYNLQGIVGWWEGTSFATPLAVGVHALALQYNPELTHEEIINFMKITADPMSTDIASADEDCSGDRCGAGLINASKMMDFVIAYSGDTAYHLRHALSQESECDQQLYLSEFGNSERLCQLYEAVIDPAGAPFEQNIQIVRVAKGEALTEANADLLIETKESIMLLDDINTEAYDYGVKFCTTAACEDVPIFSIDSSDAAKPAACDNP